MTITGELVIYIKKGNFIDSTMMWYSTVFQKRVRVFHRGFQTRENKWKHEVVGRVLLLFSIKNSFSIETKIKE